MSVMSVISVLMEIVVLLAVICAKSPCVRSGIRTHAYISRLRPERSALDHSAILTRGGQNYWTKSWYQLFSPFSTGKTRLIVVGFEPTPPKWLVPKTSALDHSATLPSTTSVQLLSQGTEIFHFKKHVVSLFEQWLRFSYFGRVSGMETGEKVHYSEEKWLFTRT